MSKEVNTEQNNVQEAVYGGKTVKEAAKALEEITEFVNEFRQTVNDENAENKAREFVEFMFRHLCFDLTLRPLIDTLARGAKNK